MAIPSSGVFELRTTGNDLNAGGFVGGSVTGTDRSQQAAAHVTFDGATITAANAGAGATITLTGYTVLAGDVDNYLRIASGTNFTAGLYRILSVNVGSNTWTMDRNCTSGAGSAMVGRMGGAVLTMAKIEADMVSGNRCYMQTGTYVDTAGTTWDVGGTEASGLMMAMEGYAVTRGDKGFVLGVDTRPVWQASGNNLTLVTSGVESTTFENIIFDGNLQTGSRGVRFTSTYESVRNCKFMKFTNSAISLEQTRTFAVGCEVTLCTTQPAVLNGSGCVIGCHIHANTVTGISISSTGVGYILNNWIVDNTGASSDGIGTSSTPLMHLIMGNVVANNGRDGYRGTTPRVIPFFNNIFYGNAGYGINQTNWVSGGSAIYTMLDHNAFGGNGTAAMNGMTVGGNNITLGGSPFVNAATGDYRINTASGPGAAISGTGLPDLIPGTSYDPNIDVGFAQASAGAGSGSGGGCGGRVSRIARV